MGTRGKSGGGCGPCPYYLSLDMQERADIIFMPYNYLIDPKLREQMGSKIPWKGAVLLFDEAHNIEGVCADAASFDISATHLAAAVGEAQEAFEIAAADEEGISAPEKLQFGGGEGVGGADADAPKKRAAIEYKQLRGVLLALEGAISSKVADLPAAGGSGAAGAGAGPG